MAARPGPTQVEALSLRSEHFRHRLEDRPQLRVAIFLPLDRLRIEPERDVVDEDAAVDLGQVDAALATVDECVESADDVFAIHPEVKCEVVAGPCRDTGVGEVELSRDHRDHRLRAVATGHRHGIGAVGHRVAHQLLQVGAELQLDRLDAPLSGLLGELELLRLAASRFRVVEEDGALGCRRSRKWRVKGEGDFAAAAASGSPAAITIAVSM